MLFSCSLYNYGQDGWDEHRINYVNPNPTLKDVTNDGMLVNFSSSSDLQQIEIFSLMEEAVSISLSSALSIIYYHVIIYR